MKIQCDSCGVAAATVVCCADEAALCARCDVEIHAANKLASKHQRLPLDALGAKLPRCDICQEKAAFIFCVEDRALFCRDCDEPIHVPGTLSGNHQRYLATGIRVGLGPVSACAAGDHGAGHDADHHAPPKVACEPHPPAQPAARAQQVPSPPQFLPQDWAVDELLQFSDYESNDKVTIQLHRRYGDLCALCLPCLGFRL
uniref:B box-type domain-containing protein n=1 Tax=Aegilops tauschii subsp. strangulata TaxID=200361 RepID=A0A453P1M6_AEGTS